LGRGRVKISSIPPLIPPPARGRETKGERRL